MSAPSFRVIALSESREFLRLMDAFNASQGYAFDRDAARGVAERFLGNPELGRAWFICDGDSPVGYLIVAFGFSFEHRGRDAFVDEFYLDAPYRGRGWGRRALEFAFDEARALGVGTLHLEVEPENTGAAALYRKLGFRGSGRELLSRSLRTNDKETTS